MDAARAAVCDPVGRARPAHVAGAGESRIFISVLYLQIEWMRRGLLSVIPQAVLDLLTWQELEKRVCGDPEITVEALKRTSQCLLFVI